MSAFVAVDLGASSGRVVLADVAPGRLVTTEIHRFANEPVRTPAGLFWDVLRLHHEILHGLRLAARTRDDVVSVGIDSWAVDYALLDASGALLANPFHYRDGRVAAVIDDVHALVPPPELYRRAGLQHLPFNTIYQLAAERVGARLGHAARLVMIPDLIAAWLTGEVSGEITNASTTGLLDVATGGWAGDLIQRLDLPGTIFPDLRQPGDVLGPLLPEVVEATGLPPATVVTIVGSHDTASAVVAVPAADDRQRHAYISCGTWSLVGVELDRPVLTEPSRLANFTNERGVDGTFRYLCNVMGLWLLQQSVAAWSADGTRAVGVAALLAEATALEPAATLVDPDDPSLLPPGDMPARIDALLGREGAAPTASPAEVVRVIVDSLAAAHARRVADAARLSGREVDLIHLIGGGSRNALLAQRTADTSGLPVVAGPSEATALGNALVQARAHGAVSGDLADLRALVAATQPLVRYEPGAGR